MKRTLLFLLMTILAMVVGTVSVSAQTTTVVWADYHIEGVEGFPWNQDEYYAFELPEGNKFGATDIFITGSKTFLFNEDGTWYAGPNFPDPNMVIWDLEMLSNGDIYYSVETGIFNLETGESLDGVYVNDDPDVGVLTFEIDGGFLYYAGDAADYDFVVVNMENMMREIFNEDDGYSGLGGVNDMITLENGNIVIASGGLFEYNPQTGDLGLVSGAPFASMIGYGALYGPFDDGTYFAGGTNTEFNTVLVTITPTDIYSAEYVQGRVLQREGIYYLNGYGRDLPGYDSYLYEIQGDWSNPTLVPVTTSNGSVIANNVGATIIGDEFWFYPTLGATPNIMGIPETYGYSVARITEGVYVDVVGATVPKINVYPNPTKDSVVVEGFPADLQMRLVNGAGQEIPVRMNNNILDLSGLPAGIYYLNGYPIVVNK